MSSLGPEGFTGKFHHIFKEEIAQIIYKLYYQNARRKNTT
jgi:hypothetical protein